MNLKSYPSPMAWVWESVEIIEAEWKTSKGARKPYVHYLLQVIGTPYCIHLNCASTERAMWKWQELEDAVRDRRRKRKAVQRSSDVTISEYVGRRMRVLLGPREYNGKWYWDVKKMIHINDPIPPPKWETEGGLDAGYL